MRKEFEWRDKKITVSKASVSKESIFVEYPSFTVENEIAEHKSEARTYPIKLTLREIEILQLKAQGFDSKQIGDLLDISGQTVKNIMLQIRHRHMKLRKDPSFIGTTELIRDAYLAQLLYPITLVALEKIKEEMFGENELPASSSATTEPTS